MAGYAVGKYSLAICDQCGQRYPYSVLKKEWTGFKVCPECYEPKHPQLEPKRGINEPIAVYDPRPESTSTVMVSVWQGGDSTFASVGMRPAPIAKALTAEGMLGTVTVSIT
jgi:NAD-dependent SIR2 family protein deacetylase